MADQNGRNQGRKPLVRVTESVLEAALDALESGKTLTAFCAEPGRPNRRNICRAIADDPGWCERFRVAREVGYDALAEEALHLVDEPARVDDKGRTDMGDVAHRRLRADVRLRLLSKWACARYGDKLQIGGDGGQPIRMSDGDALQQILALLAKAKARQLSNPQNRISKN